MNSEDAEEYTQSLGQIVSGSWRQIALAKRLGVPKALGLSTEQWVNDRLGGYVKQSVAERREAVKELTDDGLSTRDIGEIVGVSHQTVATDVKNFTDIAPDANNFKAYETDNSSNVDPIDAVAAMAAGDSLRKEAEKAEKREANKQQRSTTEKATVIHTPGRYDCIVIDPPWPMTKIEREVRPNQVGFEYPTMTLKEIAEFPIHEFTDTDCHLFCWTTQKCLPSALSILDEWEAKYVCTFVWHKPGGFQPVGLPQYNCEFVLYARFGSPKFVDTKGLPTCFNAPRREHSRKPDEFYDMLRLVTSGRRIDIFSREEREGFAQYGNETGKFAAQ